ncbi:MAG: transporter related protein [Actinomycetia bacterium]|nr:transporter related protein [Actinomycetes bacterium]
MTADAAPLLVLEGVTVHFGGITALDDVDVRVREGEVLGIIGPNGAGKTTLFDVVSGVRIPNRGTVTFGGSNVTRRSSASRARLGLRRTFQRVQIFGWLTVEENVLTALEVQGGGGGFVADLVASPFRRRRERERRRRVDEILDRCGLAAVKSELAGSLPIGVARMVELARAIVDPPRLLLLDEPASGLDQQETERLGQEIRAVRRDTGCSVLLVEHDAGFVMEQCDRIVVLDRGAVLAEGHPDEIQQDAAVRSAYLGELGRTSADTGPAEGTPAKSTPSTRTPADTR